MLTKVHVDLRAPLAAVALAAALLGGAPRFVPTARADEPAAAKRKSATAKSTTPAPNADAERARRAGVLASVGGQPITVGDLEDAIAGKDARTRARLAKPEERARFLQDLIRYDLLIGEAQRRGFDRNDSVIHRVRQAAIAQLQARELSIDPATIPAADVARYYADNAGEFSRAEQRRASFIRVASAAEARAVIADVRGKGRSAFAQLALEHSTDAQTRSQGGELGYFAREPGPRPEPHRAPQAVIDAAFALKKTGDVTPAPLSIDGQFGVVMLTAEVPPMTRTLAQVEADIREKLAQERTRSDFAAFVLRLRDQYKPETHPELVDLVATDKLESPAPLDIPSGFRADPPDPRAPAKQITPDPY